MVSLVQILLLTLASIGCVAPLGNLDKIKDTIINGTKVGIKVTESIVHQAPKIFSPDQLIAFSKESITGVPAEAIMATINKVCSIGGSRNATVSGRHVDIAALKYKLMTKDGTFSIPLLEPAKLWNHESFNKEHDTTIFVTGFLSNSSNPAVKPVYKAYEARGNINFIHLDTADLVDTLYSWSAFNTKAIGESLGVALHELVKDVPVRSIHLVGHSLGAQIIGTAGRHFQLLTNTSLPRLTGLDPANPCFNEGEGLTGIYRGDAEFVDIIHTNSGVFGKRDPLGDADFYPNGVISVQPGCIEPVCSHSRAWALWAETVHPGNENSMMAVKCNSISSLNMGACPGKPVPLGFACPRTLKGNYFLKTGGRSPFGTIHKSFLGF